MSDRSRYHLVLEDAGGPADAPAIHRLRSFLKAALRAYGLRAVRITEAKDAQPSLAIAQEEFRVEADAGTGLRLQPSANSESDA